MSDQGDGSDPPQRPDRSNMSRSDMVRQIQHRVDVNRRKAAQWAQQNQSFVHAQVERVNEDYQAPWYSRLRGFSRAANLARLEDTTVSVCADAGRRLSDDEARALSGIALEGLHFAHIIKWGTLVGAAVMVRRGFAKYRFPFFTPKFNNPMLSPVGKGRFVQATWHTLRFTAYYALISAVVEPPLIAVHASSVTAKFRENDQLRGLREEMTDKLEHQRSGESERPLSALNQASYPRDNTSSSDNFEESSSIASQAASEWSTAQRQEAPSQKTQSWSSPEQTLTARRQESSSQKTKPWSSPEQTSRTPQQQQPSESWDSRSVEDADDASPVAASYRGSQSPSDNSASSTWARLRQQSGSSSSSQPQRQQGQRNNPQRQEGDWGGSQQSYSFSKEDSEKVEAKSQAQAEFDQLLDKERRLGDDDATYQGSWRR